MEKSALRSLILAKLDDGRLPHDSIPRLWGGPGAGETCNACDEIVSKGQLVMEGINRTGITVQFHVACFSLWDGLRVVDGHLGSEPS